MEEACRPKTQAVKVKLSEGLSYADMLRKVRENVPLKDLGISVRSVHKSQEGDLLIELQQKTAVKLVKHLKEALEGVSVARLQPTMHLAVFDLDGTIGEEKVVSAIMTGMEGMAVDSTSVMVKRLTDIGRRLQKATVQVTYVGG